MKQILRGEINRILVLIECDGFSNHQENLQRVEISQGL